MSSFFLVMVLTERSSLEFHLLPLTVSINGKTEVSQMPGLGRVIRSMSKEDCVTLA